MSDVIAAPSVRALARKKGVDIEALAKELGRKTIGREDLDGAKPATVTADTSYWDVDHSQFGPVTTEPMSRIAQIAARNLSAASSVIPQVTHHDCADVSAIEGFRKDLKSEARARGIKITALAFQVRALANALRQFPRFNASLSSDGKVLTLKDYVHIGVAVDTEHGLMVPVIRDADTKGLWQISAEISDLAARAKTRKLKPDEMGGASMTVTNLGGIGGRAFTPIVNPPELAILGITRAEIAPVWDGEAFQPVEMLPLDLTYDHRVINGAEAARFMSYLVKVLCEPQRLLK